MHGTYLIDFTAVAMSRLSFLIQKQWNGSRWACYIAIKILPKYVHVPDFSGTKKVN